MKEQATERVDNTPVLDRLNFSSAKVRMTTSGTGVHNVFLASLVDLGMVGKARRAFALAAWPTIVDLNTSFPNTSRWSWAGIVGLPPVAPETIPVLERERERPAPEPVRAGVAA